MKPKHLYVIIIMLLSCTILSFADNEGTTVNLYNEKNNSATMSLELNSKYAIQFNTDTPLKEISIYIEKASANRSKLTMSLYSFDSNYSKTVRQKAVKTNTYEKFGRDSWLTLNLDSFLTGEFILVVTAESGSIDLCITKQKIEYARSFENASELSGNILSRIKTEGNESSLKKVSDISNNYVAMPDTWSATDGLNRTLPMQSEVRSKRDDKFVGIFYHTWHSNFSANSFADISQILKQNPNEKDYSKINWQNKFSYFWSEPIWGYYDTKDKWVLRKQAEMLADAGIDVIIMDNTNGTDIFKSGLLALLEVFSEARADGVKTPQVSFLLPMFGPYEDTANQLRQLYDLIYSKERYKDLWFFWKGKPLMMGCPDALNKDHPTDSAILDFFTYRPANPSLREDHAQIFDEEGNVKVYIHPPEGHITWQWISVIPQQVAYSLDGKPEQVCVSVAQNWSAEQGLTAMSINEPEKLFGRSYSTILKGHDKRENAYLYGKNFEEQWEYALEVDPEFIFITGWNEWRAGLNSEIWGTKNAFADTFDDNNSRDIEPSKGNLKDHYYYQMVSYIRRFKGVSELPKVSEPVTIDINSVKDEWNNVTPYYAAYPGNTLKRDSKGYGNLKYTQDTGRNDIVGAKVARDSEYLYFLVETISDIATDTIRLLIDVENKENQNANNWETFEYIVNRIDSENKIVLERSLGGWNWEKVGEVDYSVSGNRMQIKVPKSMLGIDSDTFTINFKWSDNMQNEGDIMDFYTNGDVAPSGRFKYRYSTEVYKKQSTNGFMKIAIIMASVISAALIGMFVLVRFKKVKKV